MRADVERSISKSATALRDIVWPRIGPLVGGGRLVPVEDVTSPGFARELDLLAGIDAWQIINEQRMRGLASRVQFGSTDWATFTVRTSLPSGQDTELQKRLTWLRSTDGTLGPHLTCQAYVDNGRLVSAAIAETKHIIRIANIGVPVGLARERRNPDGNRFVAVEWTTLIDLGHPVWIWRPT